MKEKGDRPSPQATPSPLTDAKRVLPPIPIPCGGGVGDAPVPQRGSGGTPQQQIPLNKQIKSTVSYGIA
ncbi:hypothetical protein H6F88_06760 [Oculatella sp. FACHB-28]|uniref:hypothetical protein n=1 Tax=Oculatella sp. FACHB-28 TaxID=2692845 RepID=UPI0016827E8B|nr:hypothetical protein [Oculatella sp. FACHB-28]MBD1868312.1 hypothetical protein [Cyanobacteria bacterium FACHB-471]MBD2055719.1 hypothetical protein [Oculatella sp. FACHB-28]